MAISDISLTAGMRSNLTNLQQTVGLLNRTQERLASGKSVNSALDNPVNFFAAQGHMQRANDISTYKDGMAEAVQTVKAANAGIEGITQLIESAKGLAESALAADKNEMTIALDTVAAGDAITIGGTSYSFTDGTSGGSTEIVIGSGDTQAEIAQNLANAINATTESDMDIKAKVTGNTITIEAAGAGEAITDANATVGAGGDFTVSGVINDRATLVSQYESLMEQVNSMASASGYRGVNLLRDDDLNVKFEGGSLDVNGFSATASDLGANEQASIYSSGVNGGWAINDKIQSDIKALDAATSTLRTESTKLSSNLSIITARQDFSSSMINVLQTGSDNLTLADTNEEGANMLMLQTRQQLSTTALSLSAQAAQSVLRLF